MGVWKCLLSIREFIQKTRGSLIIVVASVFDGRVSASAGSASSEFGVRTGRPHHPETGATFNLQILMQRSTAQIKMCVLSLCCRSKGSPICGSGRRHVVLTRLWEILLEIIQTGEWDWRIGAGMPCFPCTNSYK